MVEVISEEKVPADIRIISTMEMKVDNSLMGEVEPFLISRMHHPDDPFGHSLGPVQIGQRRGIVVGIAEKTLMEQIADLAANGGNHKIPFPYLGFCFWQSSQGYSAL